MASRALLILLALFVLILPLLTTDHSTAQQPPTPTIIAATAAATVEPTAEATAEPTVEVTAEPTIVPTVEAIVVPTAAATTVAMVTGDPVRGGEIFTTGMNNAPACINCHSINATGKLGFALGPGLKGIADLAATRVDGMTAEAYIDHSIRSPNDFIVPGFRGIMYANFATDYSDQTIADLVAYLMTLRQVPESVVPDA